MKVRAATSVFVAMVLVGATSSVGVAGATEPTKTVEVQEAGFSIAYPLAWKVTTNEEAEKDDAFYRENPGIAREAQPTPRFAARAAQRNRNGQLSGMIIETAESNTSVPPEPEPGLEELRDAQRESAKYRGRGFRLLDVSKQMVGRDVAVRSDFSQKQKVRGKTYAQRISELNVTLTPFVHDGITGTRNVHVTGYTTLDEAGKTTTDRILGSVKAL